MKTILETERLLLCEFELKHASFLFELNNDAEVIRYTGDKPFLSIESAENFIRNYDQYKRFGMGRWIVILKSNNEYIGWCGLKFNEEIDEVDLGFRFMRKQWRKGYATEAANACLQFGFEKLNLKKIIGRVVNDNLASVKVLEKCKMQFAGEYDFHGMDGSMYEIERT